MIIGLRDALLSVVMVEGEPEMVMIRARDRKHLEDAFGRGRFEIVHTPVADYPYRIIMNKVSFAEETVGWIGEIDYTNFKASVKDTKLSSLFHRLWFDYWLAFSGGPIPEEKES